ncbi:hypothetical protein AB0D49_08485 [Streptomyces sp. NPDC048290]|uniref:hypothetical protein n=1 Tax=Streptomyces sp. NPDC048290 TaxID=3155811 RepID=UPI00343CE5F7
MSTVPAALISFAFVAVALWLAALWMSRREARRESTRDRLVREAHERADSAARTDEATLAAASSADPWQSGRDRLHHAVHTTTEGD